MKKNKFIYYALITTFILLYVFVAFVSTLHAITFFQMGNITALALLLGISFEIGQSTILFALLMTENKNRLLAWSMMFLLTGVQISANVFATFKFMDNSGSNDWTYWQRSILFAVQAESPEMYKVIISWIQGSVLPLISLGMTGLITENLHILRGDRTEEPTKEVEAIKEEKEEPKSLFDIFKKKKDDKEDKVEVKNETTQEVKPPSLNVELKQVEDDVDFNKLKEEYDKINRTIDIPYTLPKAEFEEVKPPVVIDLPSQPIFDPEQEPNIAQSVLAPTQDDLKSVDRQLPIPSTIIMNKQIEDPSKVNAKIFPVNKPRGWRLMNEFVDDEQNVFSKGKFIEKDVLKIPTSKKA